MPRARYRGLKWPGCWPRGGGRGAFSAADLRLRALDTQRQSEGRSPPDASALAALEEAAAIRASQISALQSRSCNFFARTPADVLGLE